MRNRLVCFLILSTFLISCNSNQSFENKLFKLENLYGYRLDSVETGGTNTKINGNSIDPPRAIVVHYVIFKKEIGNLNNYLRIRTIDLSKFSEREYFEADLRHWRREDLYPPIQFSIDDNVRDTIINSNKGYFYSITINHNDQLIRRYRYIWKSKSNSNMSYDITANILENNDFNNTKNDYDNILLEMIFK